MSGDRLESWKEIAAYLDRVIRTVQRWEKLERLPVKRHAHEKLGTVYASKQEIAEWWESRRAELAARKGPANRDRGVGSSHGWRVRSPLPESSRQSTYGGRQQPRAFLSRPPAPVPVTTLRGSEYFPSFSPDGNHVAFTWINPGQSINIYAKVIAFRTPEFAQPRLDHL